ncbi:tyrosine-type recombinase/integrase [Microbacterium sp. MPKO10]|uniref:tyrosine-type recombinase/integrase n=1 Tax=Microbacterium sp. MPKO10 TaxID=2989818 RepID=UPI0022368684|nr:tyrosine-type recombinase/integrase [Microbacterium sp. MPKO10]MCW4458152.1 tyrosine-type recombinase/integrase [Microbacterium sp. MPKO10]
MARPPLVLETWGKIRRVELAPGKHAAIANYRDSDGVTRKMQRIGKSGAEAERNLVTAMKDRLAPSLEALTRDSTISQVGKLWLEEYETTDPAMGTLRSYRDVLHKVIDKGVGEIRLREATTPRIDRFIKAVAKSRGDGRAKNCRVVLSHIFKLAIRHGVMDSNPARDSAPIRTKKTHVVAPDRDVIVAVRELMHAYDTGKDGRGAVRNTDMTDLLDMYVATGARTAEVLALEWQHIDFDKTPPTVDIRGTVITGDDGKLMVQDHPKSDTSKRGLKLAPFAVEMLLRRRVDSYTSWVFPSSTGTLRWQNNMRRQWRAALKDSEYEGLTPRAFRKAVATVLDREMGTEAAMSQLGHSSDAITKKHYIERLSEGPDVTAVLQSLFEKGE